MKFRTIALATAFALSSTFGVAQAGGAGGGAGGAASGGASTGAPTSTGGAATGAHGSILSRGANGQRYGWRPRFQRQCCKKSGNHRKRDGCG